MAQMEYGKKKTGLFHKVYQLTNRVASNDDIDTIYTAVSCTAHILVCAHTHACKHTHTHTDTRKERVRQRERGVHVPVHVECVRHVIKAIQYKKQTEN